METMRWIFRLSVTLLFICSSVTSNALQPNASRVVQELLHLAQYSDDPFPAVTRVLYTKNDASARNYVKGLFVEAGLEVREDAIGNIFGR